MPEPYFLRKGNTLSYQISRQSAVKDLMVTCSVFIFFLLIKCFLPFCISLFICLASSWPESYLLIFKPSLFSYYQLLDVSSTFHPLKICFILTSDQVGSTFLPLYALKLLTIQQIIEEKIWHLFTKQSMNNRLHICQGF